MTFDLWLGKRPEKPQGETIQVDLPGFVAMASKRAAQPHTTEQYALVRFADSYRRLRNVEAVHSVTLDFDQLTPEQVDPLHRVAARWRGLMHSTKRHTSASPRMRSVLLLDRPVTAEEYKPVWLAFADTFRRHNLIVDGQAKGASKPWMWPCETAEGFGIVRQLPGRPVIADKAIAYGRALMTEPEPESYDQPSDVDPERVMDRARRYLASCEPAISGQGGQRALFWAALTMTRGFLLNPSDAADLILADYNPSCVPPWSESEVRRYCENASRFREKPLGWLLTAKKEAA